MNKELKIFKKTTSILALTIVVLFASLIGAFFIRQAYSFQDPLTDPTAAGNQSGAAADQSSLSQLETDLGSVQTNISNVNADTDSIQADLNEIKNKAGTSGYDRTTDSLEAIREKVDTISGGSSSEGGGAGPLLEWRQAPTASNGYVGILKFGPAESGSTCSLKVNDGEWGYWVPLDEGSAGDSTWEKTINLSGQLGNTMHYSAKTPGDAYSNILTQDMGVGVCGDGIIATTETCDDGNASWITGDCAADCSTINRVGSTAAFYSTADSICQNELGSGWVAASFEYMGDYIWCSPFDGTDSICGNAIRGPSEDCDDGNISWTNGSCAADCSGGNIVGYGPTCYATMCGGSYDCDAFCTLSFGCSSTYAGREEPYNLYPTDDFCFVPTASETGWCDSYTWYDTTQPNRADVKFWCQW